jgi:cytochrome b561
MNTQPQFSFTQRWLHWIVAALIFLMLPVGFWMANRGAAGLWGPLTNTLYSWHKAIGFLIIWLVLWRLALRAINRAPGYPESVSKPVRRLAKATQWLIYALVLTVALTGWASVTAFPALNTIFGWHLPAMPGIGPDRDLYQQIITIHYWAALTLCAVLTLHIAGALKHRFVNRDGVFDHISLSRSKRPNDQ